MRSLSTFLYIRNLKCTDPDPLCITLFHNWLKTVAFLSEQWKVFNRLVHLPFHPLHLSPHWILKRFLLWAWLSTTDSLCHLWKWQVRWADGEMVLEVGGAPLACGPSAWPAHPSLSQSTLKLRTGWQRLCIGKLLGVTQASRVLMFGPYEKQEREALLNLTPGLIWWQSPTCYMYAQACIGRHGICNQWLDYVNLAK